MYVKLWKMTMFFIKNKGGHKIVLEDFSRW